MKTYDHWIDGAPVAPASGEHLDTVDPYRGEVWARIARGNKEDADRAVAAAHRAMHNGPWSKMSASERGKILRRIGDLLSDPRNAKRLAEIAEATDQRRRTTLYQYKTDRARRSVHGIDQQVAKAEKAVAGQAAIKRNRFVTLTGGTRTRQP